MNEPFSSMGVDLGHNRYLIPTSYTIRNRMSTRFVMLNWIFDASIDGKKWFSLDKRIYMTQDQQYNKRVENERKLLKKRGGATTWGIDPRIMKRIDSEFQKKYNVPLKGFRFFRITQQDKNSDGSFNLALSGIELYG